MPMTMFRANLNRVSLKQQWMETIRVGSAMMSLDVNLIMEGLKRLEKLPDTTPLVFPKDKINTSPFFSVVSSSQRESRR